MGCPVMSVSSGGVGGSRLSDVGISCRTSRRRSGRRTPGGRCWLNLTNSGVVETTSELAPVLPPP